jgi:hypothetical protein
MTRWQASITGCNARPSPVAEPAPHPPPHPPNRPRKPRTPHRLAQAGLVVSLNACPKLPKNSRHAWRPSAPATRVSQLATPAEECQTRAHSCENPQRRFASAMPFGDAARQSEMSAAGVTACDVGHTSVICSSGSWLRSFGHTHTSNSFSVTASGLSGCTVWVCRSRASGVWQIGQIGRIGSGAVIRSQ